MESTFALFGEHRFEYGQVEMGLLFTYIGVLAALSQGVLVGKLVERSGESPGDDRAGWRARRLALLVVAVSESLWLLLVGLALLAVASGLVFSTTTALISLAAGEREQGSVLGLTASVGGAARIAGPVVATLLFQHAGVATPLVLGAVLFAICVAGAAWTVRPSRSPAAAA